ncbi:MAG: M3 family metallopeptidase [Burkholderiaceae bacterium]|jgi:peptidyl-dipeptidase Dcp|nr:M3 family metallopeptidase [Burkholderiaceae bacterium]
MLQHANPLLQPWETPFQLPPFERIRAEHFAPAFEVAMAEHAAEVDAIADAAEAPSFDNTVVALDRSGRRLTAIAQLFFNLTSSETSPALQAVEREVAPKLAAHESAIHLNARLFARVDALSAARDTLGLGDEQRRLLDRVHLDFVLAGARLDEQAKPRLAGIVERLAELHTTFSQNVLADEAGWVLWLATEQDLAGLPASVRDAARSAATERGRPDAWAITTSRSLVVPFLTFSDRRDLRQRAYVAWKARGESDGAHDNRPIAREILKLRTEQARLLGYASYADYALVDRMAGAPAAVLQLLQRVWEPARAKARDEYAALQAQAAALGHSTELEPWDWRYYAEKVRQVRYDVDDAQVKPYFPLDRVAEAAFDCAHRLFGVRFVERPDLKAYHPDVRVYEVQRDGRTLAIFLHDNYARSTKRSGAWMSAYRWQSRVDGEVIPIVVNNNNFAKAPAGEATLLSLDDVRTLFHEFGHGLHGMLSDVTYEGLSGTKVLRDFVELPSQIFEHWMLEPAVLKRHARHVTTGEPIPDELIARMKRAHRFNQGFETVGYTACALLDMALHARTDADGVDVTEFERAELARIGMPPGTYPYHRLPHFQHLFGGSGYAAGYYVYMWAEVLDADGYDAFTEAGDPFDPATAARLLTHIYSAGNRVEPGAAYRAFRGRDAAVEPMLAKRGLAGGEANA